jgi:predicted RecA/RadA family phage recombinase
MKNFVKPGRMMTAVAPTGGVASGDGVLIGAMFGVAATAAAETKEFELCTEGVFELPKKSADTPAAGAKVYWDNTAKEVTTTASGNTLIGVAAAAYLANTTKMLVRLNGSF